MGSSILLITLLLKVIGNIWLVFHDEVWMISGEWNLIEGLLIWGKSVIWLSHRVNGTPFFRSDFCRKPRGGTEYLRERVKESKWQKPHLDTSHVGLSILGDGRSFQEKMVTLGPCIILFNSSSNHKRKPQRETRRAYEW